MPKKTAISDHLRKRLFGGPQTQEQEELDDARELMQCVQEPYKENIIKAKAMYAKNPRLMFIKTEGNELASGIEKYVDNAGQHRTRRIYRKVKASPFQAACGNGDREIYEDMASHFVNVVDINNRTIGYERAQEQLKEQFPNGFDFPPPSEYDFSTLIAAITADQVLQEHHNQQPVTQMSESTKAALTDFQNAFAPKKTVTSGYHFNLNDLVNAFEIYQAHKKLWNSSQESLFWCQVIGYLEHLVPMVDAQTFCQCLEETIQKQNYTLARSLTLQYQDKVIPYYNTGTDGLGVECSIYFNSYFGRNGGSTDLPVTNIAYEVTQLKNYMQTQKKLPLENFKEHIDREVHTAQKRTRDDDASHTAQTTKFQK